MPKQCCGAWSSSASPLSTANAYGPRENERLIRNALFPYEKRLVLATNGGMTRSGPAMPEDHGCTADNSPAHLQQALEDSLRELGVERIDLYQLHRVDPDVPLGDTMGLLAGWQAEGKIRHIGLSPVTTAAPSAMLATAIYPGDVALHHPRGVCLLVRVVTGAHQRPRLDVAEAHRQRLLL